MERTKDLNANPRVRKAIAFIFLFHLIGLVGFYLPILQPLFYQLVPWHLLVMLVIIGYSHRNMNQDFWVFVGMISLIGFAAEWIGVNKGWLFGSYTYGETLGTKLDGIPLTIGVVWFLLIYSTGVLMQYSRIKYVLLRVIIGAAIMVGLDVLIEPVAVRFDYWHWANNIIPDKNYICWFFLSVFMLFIFEIFRFKKQSIVGIVLLAMQFVFFTVLHFLK